MNIGLVSMCFFGLGLPLSCKPWSDHQHCWGNDEKVKASESELNGKPQQGKLDWYLFITFCDGTAVAAASS